MPPNINLNSLPPQALKRIESSKNSNVSSSLLGIGSHLSIESSGFTPVGEVMGCIVQSIGFMGYAGCGWYGYGAPPPRTIICRPDQGGQWQALGPYLYAVNNGYNTAIGRMLTEAHALGADGVVGVTIKETRFEDGYREYMALGTAVRSSGSIHLQFPFTTLLTGNEVTKLTQSGWMPKAIIVVISLGIRHNDYYTRMATRSFGANAEVPGHTDLLNSIRNEVRNQISSQVNHIGADGAILSDQIRTEIHHLEAGEGHQDMLGMAHLMGSAIVKFDTHKDLKIGNSTPTVLSLKSLGRKTLK